MKTTCKRTAYYRYPVELVWRGIGFGNNAEVDPLNEEQYNNCEPERGTVFTRALEVKQNETFSFQMKTWLFYSTWRIELTSVGPCETRVKFSNTVEYRSFRGFVYSLFGYLHRSEMKAFARQLGQKIDADFQGLKSTDELKK